MTGCFVRLYIYAMSCRKGDYGNLINVDSEYCTYYRHYHTRLLLTSPWLVSREFWK